MGRHLEVLLAFLESPPDQSYSLPSNISETPPYILSRWAELITKQGIKVKKKTMKNNNDEPVSNPTYMANIRHFFNDDDLNHYEAPRNRFDDV